MQVLQPIAEDSGHTYMVKNGFGTVVEHKCQSTVKSPKRILSFCGAISLAFAALSYLYIFPSAPPAEASEPLSGSVEKSDHHNKNVCTANFASATAKHRTLDKGPLLLSPLENTVLDTPFGMVSIDSGSVVLVIVTDQELAVYNLHDKRKNAVVINYPSGAIWVSPERIAIFAKSSLKTFQEANPAPFVAYRQLSSVDLSGAMKLYQADFNFQSLTPLPGLKQLMTEKVDKARKATMGDMLKTAAIMTQYSQSSEPYGFYVTDKVRALSAAGSK
jgi:hypothetical protein